MGGQPGNYFNHSQQAKALQKGPQRHFQGASKTFTGSSSKLNAQGAKCQSCVFFDAVPFLMESKDDDIVGRGLVPYNVILPL